MTTWRKRFDRFWPFIQIVRVVLTFLGFSLVDRNIRIPEAEGMLNKALALKPFDGYIVDSVGLVIFSKETI